MRLTAKSKDEYSKYSNQGNDCDSGFEAKNTVLTSCRVLVATSWGNALYTVD